MLKFLKQLFTRNPDPFKQVTIKGIDCYTRLNVCKRLNLNHQIPAPKEISEEVDFAVFAHRSPAEYHLFIVPDVNDLEEVGQELVLHADILYVNIFKDQKVTRIWKPNY